MYKFLQLQEGIMKRIVLVSGILLLFSYYGICEIKPSTKNDIISSFKNIDKLTEQGKENLVNIYISAIEIEKRATNPYLAKEIAKKIIDTSKISEKDFNVIRSKNGFSEISIAWAISRLTKIPLTTIVSELNEYGVDYIVDKYGPECEHIASEILKLNPKKTAQN
jgi:hypothetical protein